MDLNKGSLSPVGPSVADTTLPHHPPSAIMGLNEGSLSLVGPSVADITLPPHPSSHTLRRQLQTPLASRHFKTMISEEYYNSWEEPSEYPRIPNVYEPIPGVPSSRNARNAHNTNTNSQPLNRDETKAIAIKFNIGSRRQSTSLGQSPDSENWSDHRPLEDDQANWSVTGQLGTSFPCSHDSFMYHSNPPNPPQRETDEQRQAKRQSSFEKWMNAGDRIFCHSHKAATHTRPGHEALRA